MNESNKMLDRIGQTYGELSLIREDILELESIFREVDFKLKEIIIKEGEYSKPVLAKLERANQKGEKELRKLHTSLYKMGKEIKQIKELL